MNSAGEAPTLASTANASAFNVGNALGPWAGGVAISAGLGYTSPMYVGALLAAASLIVTVVAGVLARRERPDVRARESGETVERPEVGTAMVS